MKMVLQRVSRAGVSVEGRLIGKIGRGIVMLLGVGKGDTRETADRLLEKALKLRLFPDENGKTNLSLADTGGGILIISQFTLYADCRKGNRPSFVNSADPETARGLYEYVLERCEKLAGAVEHGQFGAKMEVELVNDGPFTIVLDSSQLGREQG